MNQQIHFIYSNSIEKSSTTTSAKSKPSTTNETSNYEISPTLASSIITNHNDEQAETVPNSLELLQKRAEAALDSASQGLLSGNFVDELAFRTCANFERDTNVDNSHTRNRCRYCGKNFGSDSALQIHLRSHTGERPFKCAYPGCSTSFTTKGNLKVHYQRHTQSYYPIDMDQIQQQSIGGAQCHNTHHQISFAASHLNNIFNRTTNNSIRSVCQPLDIPEKKKKTNEDGRLSNGDKNMPTRDNYESNSIDDDHVNIGAIKTSSIGGKSMSYASVLNEKIMSLYKKGNLSKKEWENLIEISDSPETAKLEDMADKRNNKTDPNECPICNRILSCRSALRQHYRIHTGERPYRCKLCRRSFTTKGNLKTHISVHKLKPFIKTQHKCPICHKHYSNELALQQHINMHTGEPVDMPIEQIRAAELQDYQLLTLSEASGSSSINDYQLESESSSIDYNNIDMNANDSEDAKPKLDDPNSNSISIHSRARNDSDIDICENKLAAEDVPITDKRNLPIKSIGSDSDNKPISSSSIPIFSRFPRIFHPSIASNLMGAPSPHTNSMAHSMLPLTPFNSMRYPSSSLGQHHHLGINEPNHFFKDTMHIGLRGNTTCNICLKTFACHSALEIHYRSHTKERPYKCNICDRGFSTKVIKYTIKNSHNILS